MTYITLFLLSFPLPPTPFVFHFFFCFLIVSFNARLFLLLFFPLFLIFSLSPHFLSSTLSKILCFITDVLFSIYRHPFFIYSPLGNNVLTGNICLIISPLCLPVNAQSFALLLLFPSRALLPFFSPLGFPPFICPLSLSRNDIMITALVLLLRKRIHDSH